MAAFIHRLTAEAGKSAPKCFHRKHPINLAASIAPYYGPSAHEPLDVGASGDLDHIRRMGPCLRDRYTRDRLFSVLFRQGLLAYTGHAQCREASRIHGE